MLSQMKLGIELNSLRHSVGHAIFCPGCGSIMDCRRAVEVTVESGSDVLFVKAWCGNCVDTKFRTAEDASAAISSKLGKPCVVTFIDGRKFDDDDWAVADMMNAL